MIRRVCQTFRLRWTLPLLPALLLLAGCGYSDIDRQYGSTRNFSVNGTGVLAELFGEAGHKVVTKTALSPRVMENADVIVWAPDSFEAPSQEVTDWFDQWFAKGYGRTLIYIGRDFDAGPLYWEKILDAAPADKQPEIRRRRNRDRLAYQQSRATSKERAECEWFLVDPAAAPGKATELSGPWSQGIDPAKTEITLNSILEPTGVDLEDVLLSTKGDILASRQTREQWEQGELIVVANGSFLLNLPLVNHEHRKLAVRLVNRIEHKSDVVFLASGMFGPRIYDQEPASEVPTGLEVFALWPLGFILIHLAVAGMIFCYARWPIFGRPRSEAREAATDFGRHVAAVGELLELTEDRGFVYERLKQYRQR